MKVALNLLYLLPGIVGGTETYAAGLLSGLAQIDQRDEFIVFVNREAAHWPLPPAPNFSRIVCNVSATRRERRYLFEQMIFPRLLKVNKIDLVHSLGYVGPLLTPCPSVVTVPDLNYIDLAYAMPWVKRIFLYLFSLAAARRADHVITISRFSAARLREVLGDSKRKISVTYLGPREMSGAASAHDDDLGILARYGICRPYIAAFGGGSLHKNVRRLIQAFATLTDEFPHRLVLIGRLPPDVDLMTLSDDSRLCQRIIATGYVPDNHIIPLLNRADLFVVASLYEGFGLPVLEAQQAEVAVACSTAGSLPEVAGAGAIFFDPTSVSAISDAIRRCLSDSALRLELIRLGEENLKRFSWDQTAQKTLSIYHEVLEDRRRIYARRQFSSRGKCNPSNRSDTV